MYDCYMRFPGFKAKAVTFSYDDGVEQDLQLMELMNRFGLKGTFNINSGLMAPEGTVYPAGQLHRRLPASAIRDCYLSGGHEIALHAYRHLRMNELTDSLLDYEILQDRLTLESLLGRVVRGFAFPYGVYDERVLDALRRHGILYARGVPSTFSFRVPDDFIGFDPTCRYSDEGVDALIGRFLEETPLTACHDRWPWLFYMWGHSYEFERDGSWERIGAQLERLSGHGDVWYATNGEIFSYAADYRRLVFSADGSLAYNPTCRTLYLENSGRNYVLQPGETAALEKEPAGGYVPAAH